MKRNSFGTAEIARKKLKINDNFEQYLALNKVYYPNPINCGEANKYNNNSRPKPINILNNHRSNQNSLDGFKVFIHWFRSDLRVTDNKALYEIVRKFKKMKNEDPTVRLLTVFVINEHDWRAHLDSGWKLQFMLKGLKSLQERLSKISVPLHILQFEPELPSLSNTTSFVSWFKKECEKLAGGSTPTFVTANAEYEADEIYRDIKIFRSVDSSFNFQVYHDACVIDPGSLTSGKGSQYKIFTPWYKKWANEIAISDAWKNNTFISNIAENEAYNEDFEPARFNYHLKPEFTSYIPQISLEVPEANESAANELLATFLKDKVNAYNDKDFLLSEGSSHLSCYISSGIISTRVIVHEAEKVSTGGLICKDLKTNTPVQEFIREIAWRDFYKHALCNWPYISMDLPFQFEFTKLKWNNDENTFKSWCLGNTGVPIVDAIMRKLLNTGYINNRARMIVASFLSKNLLLDWRWGERWFRKHLIDFDLASNVGGWGFCSSTGIDSQPYFRIFNMELQSKRYDLDGNFIKKWVPELSSCSAVHSINKKIDGYRSPIVDIKHSREEALAAYREVI